MEFFRVTLNTSTFICRHFPRDDMEAFGYIILHLGGTSLPWKKSADEEGPKFLNEILGVKKKFCEGDRNAKVTQKTSIAFILRI